MIKRNGIEIMNARTQNVKIAKETIDICKNGKYNSRIGNEVSIAQSLNQAIKGTIFYPPEATVPNAGRKVVASTIEVVNETTTEAAKRLDAMGKTNIVALNFASARNQGGGFLGGAVAQEESLCRKSGLYPCLKSKPLFYNANILCDDIYYTDGVIYSPNVPFFRDENELLIENPWELSVISAPAPNLNGTRPEGFQHKLRGIIGGRIERVLYIAAAHEHKNIILGAWGCGAYGNDPEMIADEFKKMINKVYAFEHVCFAVYDTREPPVLFESFKKVIYNG